MGTEKEIKHFAELSKEQIDVLVNFVTSHFLGTCFNYCPNNIRFNLFSKDDGERIKKFVKEIVLDYFVLHNFKCNTWLSKTLKAQVNIPDDSFDEVYLQLKAKFTKIADELKQRRTNDILELFENGLNA